MEEVLNYFGIKREDLSIRYKVNGRRWIIRSFSLSWWLVVIPVFMVTILTLHFLLVSVLLLVPTIYLI